MNCTHDQRHGGRREALRCRSSKWLCLAFLLLVGEYVQGAELPAATHFRKDIQPILSKYCYDCHGDGSSKGDVSLDEFASDAALVGNHELWLKVMKNVRGGLMPPQKQKARP